MPVPGGKASHPVEIQCPRCASTLRRPIRAFTLGAVIRCPACKFDLRVDSQTISRLLREIESDLKAPDDLPLILRPPETRPVERPGAETGEAGNDS